MSIGKWTRGLVALGFFGALLGTSQACIESEGGLYIIQAVEVPEDTGTAVDACGTASSSVIFQNSGNVTDRSGTQVLLDGAEYPVFALVCVQNHLRSRDDNGVETSNIILYKYEVTTSGGDTSEHAIAKSIAASPEDGVTGLDASQSTALVELLTAAQVSALAGGLADGEAAEEVVSVKVYGRTTGGLEVESPEFSMPVRVFRQDQQCSCSGDGFPCSESDPGCQ